MIGLIIMIIFLVRIHSLAKQIGKSALLWVLIAIVSYLGIQSVIAIVALLTFDLLMEESLITRFIIPLIFFSEFLSLLGVWTILNYLKARKEDEKK